MKKFIYAIRDVHTGFLTPMTDVNDQTAIRNFRHALMNKDSLFFSAPKDYSLYRIGEYESDTGLITAYGVPEIVCEALSLMEA